MPQIKKKIITSDNIITIKQRIKNEVSLNKVESLLSLYKTAHNAIQTITDDSNIEDLNKVLSVLVDCCKANTDGYCRKLWTIAREELAETKNHITPIDDICESTCYLWSKCPQNKVVREGDGSYGLLIRVWKRLLECKKKNRISARDKRFFKDKVLKLKTKNNEINSFMKSYRRYK